MFGLHSFSSPFRSWGYTRASLHRMLAGLAALGISLATVGCQSGSPSELAPEPYAQAISSFYAGLTALQVGELGYAEQRLARLTDLAPQEPAAWANYGIVAMRRGDYEAAESRLEEAVSLAPDNVQIAFLQGVLARQRGAFDVAAERFRAVAAQDTTDARVRYALVQVLQRRDLANDQGEIRRLLEHLLAQHPDNLILLLQQVRLAAQDGDLARLYPAAQRLAAQTTEAWPSEANVRLKALQQAIQSSAPGEAAQQAVFLENVLKRVPAYRTDRSVLLPSPTAPVGEPLAELLRLDAPRPNPAPPDSALAFASAPLLAGDASAAWTWAGALLLATDPSSQQEIPAPSAVGADGRQVQIENGPALPFPGGASNTPPGPHGIAAVDYDYDFRRDLVLAGAGGLRLYRQDSLDVFARARAAEAPTPSFTEATASLDLPHTVTQTAYAGVWAQDLDQEGDLDLVLAPRGGGLPQALRNDGDGTFSRWPLFGDQHFDGSPHELRGFAWADLSGDGDPDAVFLDAAGRLYAMENGRAGTFEAVALPPQPERVKAIAAADINRDGRLDLLALRIDGAVVRFSYQPASSGFATAPLARFPSQALTNAPDAAPGSGAYRLFAADLDNNGGLDILASGPGGSHLWLSDDRDRFQSGLRRDFEARVSAVSDLDGDGQLDLVGHAPKEPKPIRLLGQGAKNYRAKSVRPRAARTRGDRRINPFGIGGEISLRTGLLYQKQPIEDAVVHFGIGLKDSVDVARIVWPNGTVQAEFDLPSDRSALAEQRLKGSCPWLFAYDGEAMRFVTDLLWSTALGLRINAQGRSTVLHSIDWVKVDGRELAPRPNGEYDLRITAELWETHYYDHVALLAVDHPEQAEVFVDERFILPPTEPAVHAMTPPRPVARAWNSTGQEVTDAVRHLDGRYLDDFALGPYQGVAEKHYVEIEVGADTEEADRPLWLLASGWVYPTDTSINLAASQGERPPLKSLSMAIPDGEGGWTVVKPDLGFPAGKDKTMLIDLSGVSFPAGAPRRLRLYTNMEVYWDRLAWARGLPGARLRTQRLPVKTSTLRYRGFSPTHKPHRSVPERPAAYRPVAATGARWRDLVGYYTRFGEVNELLEDSDDRYVIMNAGDELALRFQAPPPPPAGWTRDFVMIGDGWIKDGDYNTGYSKTVRPLPYHGLDHYDAPLLPLEEDPAYRKHPGDWQTYHTRYVAPDDFHAPLAPH